jgi:Acetyltransferases, including N-acetylases of ribosomal proteins
MIKLRPVDRNNIDDVLALQVRDDQKTFVSTAAESLAQAYVYPENAFPFAVYDDDVMVGFIMMGYYELKHYYTLWKFLIDKKYQRKGFGRQALLLGIRFLKEKFDVHEVYTGVIPDNMAAKALYSSVGFRYTGLTENGMEEMCCRIK